MIKEIRNILTIWMLNSAFAICPTSKFKNELCIFLLNNIKKM